MLTPRKQTECDIQDQLQVVETGVSRIQRVWPTSLQGACFSYNKCPLLTPNLLTEIVLTDKTWPFKSLLNPILSGKELVRKRLKDTSEKGEVNVCKREGNKDVF